MGAGELEFAVGLWIVLAECVGDFEGVGAVFFGDIGEGKGDVFESAWVVLAFGIDGAHWFSFCDDPTPVQTASTRHSSTAVIRPLSPLAAVWW